MNGLTLHIQDGTGLRKTICRATPLPVEVRGMDSLADEIAARIGDHIIKPPDISVAAPAVIVEPPAVTVEAPNVNYVIDARCIADVLGRYARLFLVGAFIFGAVQTGAILFMVFVR